MSAPPPPLPPRPPGMARPMPPLPPGMMRAATAGAATQPTKMPPLPPGLQRPPAAVPTTAAAAPVDHARYPVPPPSAYHPPAGGPAPRPPPPGREAGRYMYPGSAPPGESTAAPPPSSSYGPGTRAPQSPYPPHERGQDRYYGGGGGREDYYYGGGPRGYDAEREYRGGGNGSAGGYPTPGGRYGGGSERGDPYYPPPPMRHAPYPDEPQDRRGDYDGGYYDRGPSYYREYDRPARPGPPRGGPAAPYPPPRSYGAGPPSHHHHRDTPMPLRDPTNTVWIGSLDPVLHSDAILQREMGRYGMVMRIARQQEKNYGFVHFRRVEEAQAAVEGLTQSGVLGPAVFNYGKMFDYTPEEMAMPYDPNNPPPLPSSQHDSAMPGGRGDETGGEEDAAMRRPTRRARNEPPTMEPSNVLWLGSLPPFISDERLREVFEVFGPIKLISRMDKGNMAFIHFDTEEHCTLALQTMKDRPIESGVVLALNYGHAQRNARTEDGGAAAASSSAPPANEVATNVVYLGQLPSDVTEAELDELFSQYEGFINCKLLSQTGIAFGHYDTIDHARTARVALHNTTLKGVPIRVSFGKQNHSLTLADRRPALGGLGHSGEAAGGFNLDAMMRDPNEAGALVPGGEAGGALTAMQAGGLGAHGALTLPAMGGGGGDGLGRGGMDGVYDKPRVAPALSMDVRLQTLLGSPYNDCGAKDLELSSTQIQALCNMVDYCVDEATEQQLDQALLLYVPAKCVHVFNVVAKRLHECYNDDPHKKLLVLYAVTRVLLGAVTDYIAYTSDGLNAYVMVLLAASQGQTSGGMDRLETIIESLQHHSFIEKKAKVSAEYVEEFRAQLDEVLNRAKAEQDLSSLVPKRRRR